MQIIKCGNFGSESSSSWICEAIVLTWCLVMAALSRSRRVFIHDGSRFAKSEAPVNLKTMPKTCLAVKMIENPRVLGNTGADMCDLCIETLLGDPFLVQARCEYVFRSCSLDMFGQTRLDAP